MSHTTNLGERPNEQQIVIEALSVAAERKPLEAVAAPLTHARPE